MEVKRFFKYKYQYVFVYMARKQREYVFGMWKYMVYFSFEQWGGDKMSRLRLSISECFTTNIFSSRNILIMYSCCVIKM